MSDSKPPLYVVVSYCPLLMGPVWPMYDLKSEDATALTKAIDELPSGVAKGCLWVSDDGKPAPVFLFENASSIYEHLVLWAEDKPEEWFEYAMKTKDGRYAIVCFPRLQKSIDRWKINYQLSTGFPVHHEAQFSLLFKPLTFISQNMGVFNKVKGSLKGKMLSIGFLDWAANEAPNPSNVNLDDVQWIKVPIAKKRNYDKYLDELFKKD